MMCDEARVLLFDHWSGTLDEAQELAFEGHVANCEPCRTESERLGALWANLALLPAEEPSAQLRGRFYETLGAFRQGLESAPKRGVRERIESLWPRQPAWQMAASFALLAIGVAVGYAIHPTRVEPQNISELAQLRGEVNNMRQMVALSLMQQQSAGERLRGVSWAYQVEPSDTEVLQALLTTVNQDSSVNVRLAAVDALHAFGSSAGMRTAILKAIPKQTAPLVQIALIDLLVDLKKKEAAPELRELAADPSVHAGVRQRATWAVQRLQ
jgi:HEAT repeats/Putative zinc-finger